MDKCVVCGGEEFYIEAGFYFCKECQTQQQGKREEVVEFRFDQSTRVKKTRIQKQKSDAGTNDPDEPGTGWTSWEKFNFILIGLTNELITLGVDPSIKLTVLQLWTTYLRKLEVGFTSTTKVTIPKFSKRYYAKDADIIYGKAKQKKKKKRSRAGSGASGSSMVSTHMSEASSNRELGRQKKLFVTSEYDKYMKSQASSDGETASMTNQSLYSIKSSVQSGPTMKKIKFNQAARKEIKKIKCLAKKRPRLVRKKFKKTSLTFGYSQGPQIITPLKLWGILYLALLLKHERFHLADMIRFGREGHLSYYRLEHLLPPDVLLTSAEFSRLQPTKMISHKGFRRATAEMATCLEVHVIPEVNLLELMERYVTELQLPKNILHYAERMLAKSPPKLRWKLTNKQVANYEGRAMAYIIVVMKLFFGLDGITEVENSYTIERINK